MKNNIYTLYLLLIAVIANKLQNSIVTNINITYGLLPKTVSYSVGSVNINQPLLFGKLFWHIAKQSKIRNYVIQFLSKIFLKKDDLDFLSALRNLLPVYY